MSTSAATRIGELGRASRLRVHTAYEVVLLVVAGVVATAAVAFIPLQLRIPGHAILKAALPIVCGVALAPRAFAGTIAGASAGFTAGVLLLGGMGNLQTSALTGLLAIGPAIDLATRTATSGGWSLYLRFALAGLAANLLAFAVRWSTAALGLDGFRPHMMQQFGLGVMTSFAVCGILAGLVSAMICFRSSRGER